MDMDMDMKNYLLQQYIKLKLLLKKEDGASAIEYAIIAGFLALAIITAANGLGVDIGTVFGNIGDTLEAKIPAPQ
ncbi:Flp family type IVb pilin [Zobellella aerophila]